MQSRWDWLRGRTPQEDGSGMEVKPGYKQTEVGVIPEEWEAVPLKGKVGIAHGFAFASEHFASHGPYRLATPGHFYEAGGFRDIGEKQKYYVGPVPNDYVLQPGDLIVAMTEQADGLLGSAAVIPEEHGYLHNQRLGRVTVLSSEIQLDYLVYVFNSLSYRTKVRETAAGTKVKHTSPEKLLEIPVRLPLPPEQRAIATALSDVDGLLGGLDRLIAKKRDLKQAAMQQLLTGQTRLPGFHGEWEVKRFGKLYAEPSRNGVYKSAEFQGRGIRIVNMGEMFGLDFISDQEMSRVSLTPKEIATSGLRDGDLLFGRRSVVPAGAGKCSLVVKPLEPLIFESSIIRVRLEQAEANPLFHYYFFASSTGRAVMGIIISGTNVKGIRASELRELKIPHPPLPEQTAIAEVLTEMDGELAVLEQRREKTRALKQAMMQELLTGRVRLIENG